MAKCKNVKEAVHAIKLHHPDLVFLDIEMPPDNGFQVLEALEDKNFEIIFTTAFDQYAIKAIKFSALDFLLKPFGANDLIEAMKRYDEKIKKEISQKQYEVLLYNLKNVSDPAKRIALPTLNGFNVVSLSDIVRCKADNNYTDFYFTNKTKTVVSKPLKEFDDLLEDHSFLRIHQSHLINLQHVVNYSKGEGGTVKMSDGSVIEVSRRKKDEFLKYMLSK
ncbi:MAG: LytTR family DNA-binding domain-containing protein [bacterium]